MQDGNSSSSPEVTRVCGEVLPPNIEAYGSIRIAFNTDSDKEFEGFHISYQTGKALTKANKEILLSSNIGDKKNSSLTLHS